SPVKLGPESLVYFVLICSESTTSSSTIIFLVLMGAFGVSTALGACGFFTSSGLVSFTGSVDFSGVFSAGFSSFLVSVLAVFSSACFSSLIGSFSTGSALVSVLGLVSKLGDCSSTLSIGFSSLEASAAAASSFFLPLS